MGLSFLLTLSLDCNLIPCVRERQTERDRQTEREAYKKNET